MCTRETQAGGCVIVHIYNNRAAAFDLICIAILQQLIDSNVRIIRQCTHLTKEYMSGLCQLKFNTSNYRIYW